MITRRKFFSFFGAGVVMAARPELLSMADQFKISDQTGLEMAHEFFLYLDDYTRKLILRGILEVKHA